MRVGKIADMKHEMNNHSETRNMVVFMFRVDGEGVEIGEPLPITLLPGGSADLSHVSPAQRETWEKIGVCPPGGMDFVKPKNGRAFLQALLQSTNGYHRFRRSSERV